MKSGFVVRAAIGLLIAGSASGAAFAQDAVRGCRPADPGHHQRRHQYHLSRPGRKRADLTPGGNTVPATWQVANGQLCLNNGAAQECWPYSAPFQAGQPVTLTSSCNATSTWLAQATNSAAASGRQGRTRPLSRAANFEFVAAAP